MLRFSRAVRLLGASVACMLFGTTRLHAQLSGRHVGGSGFSTIDEAALGDTVLSSVGFFLGAHEYTAGGGIGAAGGAFRGYAGTAAETGGKEWSVGAGYARSLATRELPGQIHVTLGGELLGGVRHTPVAPREAGAIDMTVPLGLSFGSPSGPSLGFYAAPYAEAGAGRQWVNAPCGQGLQCSTLGDVGLTHALGVDAGIRMAFGRFSAGFMLLDVLERGRWPFDVGGGVIGLTYRIGH